MHLQVCTLYWREEVSYGVLEEWEALPVRGSRREHFE